MTINSVEAFIQLCESKQPGDNHRLKSAEITEEVLLQVLEQYPEWVFAVIGCNAVTLPILETLAQSPDPGIRWWVAMKRKLSPILFEQLSVDGDPSVRERIACNAKTPDPILQRLAHDEVASVAQAAQERLAKHTVE